MRLRRFVMLCIALVVTLCVVAPAEARTASPEVRVYFDDTGIEFADRSPYIENGRTLVPVSYVSTALQAHVDYDPTTKQVTIVKDGKAVFLTLGSCQAIVEGEAATLDVAPALVSDEVMVPLRFVSEALGAWVEWWGSDRSVRVYSAAPTAPAMANIMNEGLAAYADGWMYYVLYDGIYRSRRDGSEHSKIADTEASHLNVLGDWVIFSPNHYDYRSSNNYSGSPWVFRVPVDGGEPEEVAHVDARQVAVVNDHIYYGGIEYDTFERSVYRMDVDGSNPERLVGNVVSRYYVDGDWVYYNYNNIYRAKTDGTATEQIGDLTVLNYMIVSDGSVYCVRRDDRFIYRVSTDGTEKKQLTDCRCQGLNVADGWVYFATEVTKTEDPADQVLPEIRRMRTDGSDTQVLATFREPQCWSLCVVDGWVYFETISASETKPSHPVYTLYRVRTDGSGFELLGQKQ